MQRLLLMAFSLAISAVAISSFSSTSMAADASPKTSAAPDSPSADTPSWKEYKKLLENYYFLDKQKAGHISCSVSVYPLQAVIDALRQKFGNQLTIDENIHDFSVTYDHTKGVSFNSPHIKASLLPDAKFSGSTHEQDENWRKKIEKEFDENINYVEKMITGLLLTDSTSPIPEKQRNLSLTKNGEATIVSFNDSDNYNNKITFSGTTQEQTTSSPTFNVTSKSDYQTLNGKLALAHYVAEKTLGSTKKNATLSVSYQDLGSVFFPAQLLNDITTSGDTQKTNPQHFEINFKDCKTSDLSP